jgi:hypothetical protein
MDDPVLVQVVHALQQLLHQALDLQSKAESENGLKSLAPHVLT